MSTFYNSCRLVACNRWCVAFCVFDNHLLFDYFSCRYGGRYINNRYGPGSGHIWLDNVHCNCMDASIAQCLHNGWGIHNCGHIEDVSVSCNTGIVDHLGSGVVYNFCSVCLSVCLSVSVCMSVCLSDDNFPMPSRSKFIFPHAVYLQGIQIKFANGHRIEVNVTGAK